MELLFPLRKSGQWNGHRRPHPLTRPYIMLKASTTVHGQQRISTAGLLMCSHVYGMKVRGACDNMFEEELKSVMSLEASKNFFKDDLTAHQILLSCLGVPNGMYEGIRLIVVRLCKYSVPSVWSVLELENK